MANAIGDDRQLPFRRDRRNVGADVRQRRGVRAVETRGVDPLRAAVPHRGVHERRGVRHHARRRDQPAAIGQAVELRRRLRRLASTAVVPAMNAAAPTTSDAPPQPLRRGIPFARRTRRSPPPSWPCSSSTRPRALRARSRGRARNGNDRHGCFSRQRRTMRSSEPGSVRIDRRRTPADLLSGSRSSSRRANRRGTARRPVSIS